MKPLQLAFLPLARTTFDIELARQVTQAARQSLIESGLSLAGPDELITDLSAAKSAARALQQEAPDLLVIFQATFADSSMVTTLVEACESPVFLWAVPESWTGSRLRLNSLCGINLAGHALTLRNQRYGYAYALPDDRAVLETVRVWAAAGNLRRRLRSSQLGVVGEHPTGMDSCHLDEPLLRHKLGIGVHKIELAEVFERARRIQQTELIAVRAQLEQRLENLTAMEQQPLQGTLSVYAALSQIASEKKLDALAVRCWPEFFTQMGCAACGAMSLLSDGFNLQAPIPCSCEADVNGTITQLLLQWLANAPAFGSDIVGLDFEQENIALWHCGLAPLSMADPAVTPRGGIHSNRRLPLVMEFPLRPGPVTIARLSRASGELRLVLGRGEILSSPAPFSGTSGVLRPERPVRQFFDTLMGEGLEHHLSLVYGDFGAELQTFAHILDLPLLTI